MKNIYLQIADDRNHGTNLVLATVTRTQGSTPQKPGSSALFSDKGLLQGTVGGGIVEGRVQNAAIEAISSKKSGHFTYSLYNDISKTEEAICGGTITVLIDANPDKSIPILSQVRKSLEERIPGVLITMVAGSDESNVQINRYWMSSSSVPDLPHELLSNITPVVGEMLASRNSYNYRELNLSLKNKGSSSLLFLEPVFPPEHLVIAGAGHIGRSLAHLGSLLGFEVTVIDDRAEYANRENIPDADHIIVKNIGSAICELKKGEDTFVVIVTHGHKDDAEALKPCIGSGLAYTGMIGSRKKVTAIRESFLEKGFATKEQWDLIHAPVGIDIKSQTVEEIAVSIAAQLIQVRNCKR